jgi:hypothetical protein
MQQPQNQNRCQCEKPTESMASSIKPMIMSCTCHVDVIGLMGLAMYGAIN